MPCGRRPMTCVLCRRIMQRSLTAKKAMFTIQVSPALINSTLSNFDSSPVLIFPDTVWQLIGLTNWILDFLERLMKECILFGEQPACADGERADGDDDDDLFEIGRAHV